MKELLEIGNHIVTIKEITKGNSKKNNLPYINCRFENENGFLIKHFFLTTGALKYTKKLFEAVGINEEDVDTDDLIGKELMITVYLRDFVDPMTGEKTGKKSLDCKNFEMKPTT